MSGEMNMKVLLASYRTADKIRNADKKIRNDTNMKMTLTKSITIYYMRVRVNAVG